MTTAPLPIDATRAELEEAARHDLSRLVTQIQRVIVGQQPVIWDVVTCLLANGHGLLEGVPGLGQDATGSRVGAIR